jgi:hypothetical protein
VRAMAWPVIAEHHDWIEGQLGVPVVIAQRLSDDRIDKGSESSVRRCVTAALGLQQRRERMRGALRSLTSAEGVMSRAVIAQVAISTGLGLSDSWGDTTDSNSTMSRPRILTWIDVVRLTRLNSELSARGAARRIRP